MGWRKCPEQFTSMSNFKNMFKGSWQPRSKSINKKQKCLLKNLISSIRPGNLSNTKILSLVAKSISNLSSYRKFANRPSPKSRTCIRKISEKNSSNNHTPYSITSEFVKDCSTKWLKSTPSNKWTVIINFSANLILSWKALIKKCSASTRRKLCWNGRKRISKNCLILRQNLTLTTNSSLFTKIISWMCCHSTRSPSVLLTISHSLRI